MKANGENGDASTSSAEQQLADELADIDLNDSELAQAASKIQKQFRGLKKGGALAKKESDTPSAPVEPSPPPEVEKTETDELADIDLTDPELEKAAMKIQSTFKGFKTRRAPATK
ncbi:obscurin-like [Varroa destructor]|uniref:Uncharacterized protein n=1 Tax=Varroa destructor TaxID=109461 RepID=A0A7M7J4I1_VARDE|nr:obscurin-like [Varroa destructor]